MNQRLKTLYGNVAVHATADLEHQAAIDLLLLVMIADRHITDEEMNEIRRISEDSGFESATFSFDQYLGPAMAKVRTAVNEGRAEELLDDIDQRVTSSVLRQSLFSAARDVAGVDHRIGDDEQTLLAQVAARFA